MLVVLNTILCAELIENLS